MDSTIRLRQLNQPELSGYIVSVFAAQSQLNTSGNIVPSGSGVYNLGSTSNYYKNVYSNGLTLPSGSGIQIGSSFVTAFTSGGAGVVKIDNYTIVSSGNFISIQGPQGIQGPSGATGITGATGTSITGASYSGSTYRLYLQLSNGTTTGVYIPPLSGATGISITGFFQSGSIIYPQFDNFRGTGSAIYLPSGAQGIQGLPGTVTFDYYSGLTPNTGSYTEVNFPSGAYILDYYDSNVFPAISLMRGMTYTVNLSGLNTHTINEEDYLLLSGSLTGTTVPTGIIGGQSNYYSDSVNGTGYWRLAFFDKDSQVGIYSGQYADENTFLNAFSSAGRAVKNDEVFGSYYYPDLYRTSLTFNTRFTAQNQYKYGFIVYSLQDQVMTEDSFTNAYSFAIITGDAYVSSGVGPIGPQGIQGIQGAVGPVGPIGPTGPQGDNGADIVAINQGVYEIQFVFSDGSTSPWITLPAGGPAGPSGATGPAGSLTNYFSGEYLNTNTYKQNDTVSRIGSSYIYTGSSPTAGNPPESGIYWQLLAMSGAVGATGATGVSGVADKYSTSFYVQSGFPTGVGSYLNGITGITVNGTGLSGTAARFLTGQVVSFRNSGLVGYSYTPYQSIILSSNSVTNSYCFGTVSSYNPTSGILSFTVSSGGTGVVNSTISGGYFLWYNYNNATVNLGANLMSGSPGPQGPVGPQGPSGQPSLLRNSNNIVANYDNGTGILLQPSGLDVFNIIISGNGTQYPGVDKIGIDFDWSYFNTGKCVLLKVRNLGIPDGNNEPSLFYFSGYSLNRIKWPNDIFTCPNQGQVFIYSILRFADDVDNQISCFGTYTNPYTY